MTQAKSRVSPETTATLESLVAEIKYFEMAIANWDESQKVVVEGLKKSIEALHKEALTRLIRHLKKESISTLREAVEDEIIYGLLRYHELIKPPLPPLEVRVEQALEEVRPGLKSHEGDVELVAIAPPDTVKVRLVGTCSNCPASTLTLKEGVERIIKKYCPEIENVISVSEPAAGQTGNNTNYSHSPFASDALPGWIPLTTIDDIPSEGVLAVDLDGLKLIVSRSGDRILVYHNSCSHLAMPLDGGQVEDGILSCPFHGFRYRLETGECLTAPEMSLQPHPVKVRGDRVLIRAA